MKSSSRHQKFRLPVRYSELAGAGHTGLCFSCTDTVALLSLSGAGKLVGGEEVSLEDESVSGIDYWIKRQSPDRKQEVKW